MNYYAGLKDPSKPIHVFLFLGSSGVGKTELAKVTANLLSTNKNNLIRLDMSQYVEPHSITRLIGPPPGYVGARDGGQLTNALLDNPHCVVLLDEIEKANPIVVKFFLSAFDDGYITDSSGKVILCNETLFIMTSNLCSPEISKSYEQGDDADDILLRIEPKLMEALSPEFYNRVDPILFRPLAPATIRKLVNMSLDQLAKTVKSTKGLTVVFDESVRDYVALHGYHPTLGARPLKRLIQKKITPLISTVLLTKSNQAAKRLILSYDSSKDEFLIHWSVERSSQ